MRNGELQLELLLGRGCLALLLHGFGIFTQIPKASERNHEDTVPGRIDATSKSPLGDIVVVSRTRTIAARGSVSEVHLNLIFESQSLEDYG